MGDTFTPFKYTHRLFALKLSVTVYAILPISIVLDIFSFLSSNVLVETPPTLLSSIICVLVSPAEVLYDIALNQGPKDYLILSGIAIWSPGQLDFEMVKGDWYKKLNSYIPMFNHGNEMWSRLIRSQDI